MNRRQFLRFGGRIGLGLSAGWLASCGGDSASSSASDGGAATVNPFTHAVTSGDPLPDRVILWTRALPEDEQSRVRLRWVVARDPALTDLIATGDIETGPERDFTVKVDALLPEADTHYWYQFEAMGWLSPVGRTRTAPRTADAGLRLAVSTCTNPEVAELNSLRVLAARDDLNAIVHLGDYIYEFGGNPDYQPEHECVTLADYRLRHGCFRAYAPNLEAHRLHPWIVIYDDGDISNGCATDAGQDGSHDPVTEGDWGARKRAATQAFEEWVPCRIERHTADGMPVIYRRLAWGELLDIFMIDTRLDGRDAIGGDDYLSYGAVDLDAEERRIMSTEQMQWLCDGLAASTATWKLVGNQAMLGHWAAPGSPEALSPLLAFLGARQNGNLLYATTSWNGYTADRRRLYAALKAADVRNLIVVSGDAHLSFAMDLAEDPYNPLVYDPLTARNSLGVEFSVPSINSETFVEIIGVQPRTVSVAIETGSLLVNPHHRYAELDSKGYLLLEMNRDEAVGEFWMMRDPWSVNQDEELGGRFRSPAGSNRLITEYLNPLAARAGTPKRRAI